MVNGLSARVIERAKWTKSVTISFISRIPITRVPNDRTFTAVDHLIHVHSITRTFTRAHVGDDALKTLLKVHTCKHTNQSLDVVAEKLQTDHTDSKLRIDLNLARPPKKTLLSFLLCLSLVFISTLKWGWNGTITSCPTG